jgi:uncharacterized repeat protein (TIGR02543 family)
MNTVINKRIGTRTGAALLGVFLCVGMFAGCKDMFHPGGPKTVQYTPEEPNYYTVTFDADGGSPSTQTRTVQSGGTVGYSNMPSEPTRSGYTFKGWYSERDGTNGSQLFDDSSRVYNNKTVYAWWTLARIPDNLSLNDALTWISNNMITGDTYTIMLRNNETIAPKMLSYSGKTVGITLTGGITERTVSLSTPGSLFTVESGVMLTLDNNVTLQGRSDNTASLVRVNSGGSLVMNTGSKVSGNTVSKDYAHGGGVYVSGTFTMNGGDISNNSIYSYYGGGGVHIDSNGTFTMSGGKIKNNSAYNYSSSNSTNGGGVSVWGGVFTMNGGEVSDNSAYNYDSNPSSYGGGVDVYGGMFTMSGGTISGNTASYGGGVYVSGSFIKQSNGIIYGSNASSGLKNTASYGDNNGHAVYVSGSVKKRNTTAGSDVTMNSAVSGSAGGWE